mmetsp:Transcript_139023/g.361254  ORF Transcript_139023/g.361254 Transcript_139023/m.361254 type:complete len:102 (+) Transcript_139023:422-727(+)
MSSMQTASSHGGHIVPKALSRARHADRRRHSWARPPMRVSLDGTSGHSCRIGSRCTQPILSTDLFANIWDEKRGCSVGVLRHSLFEAVGAVLLGICLPIST